VLAITEALSVCLLVSLVLRAPVFALLAIAYLAAAALFIVACVAFPVLGVAIIAIAALVSLSRLDRTFARR
jgi:hypothetical protein